MRSEFESEESGCGVGLYQLEAATTLLHYLARDAKSDAAACGLGCEERDEDLLGLLGGNGVAVVTDVYEDGVVGSSVGRYGYGCSSGFDGVLQQIGDDMGYEAFIGIEEKVGDGDVEVDVVVEQLLSGLFVDFYWSLVIEIGEFLDELLGERFYLILTFTQWWKVEAYGVHAIEQVFAECTFPHHILQVAVGG